MHTASDPASFTASWSYERVPASIGDASSRIAMRLSERVDKTTAHSLPVVAHVVQHGSRSSNSKAGQSTRAGAMAIARSTSRLHVITARVEQYSKSRHQPQLH